MITRTLLTLGILSTSLLTYITWQVSPFTTYPQLNIAIVVLFFAAVFVSASTIFALVALRLHSYWPSMAGAHGRKPEPIVAVRQGLLFGLALIVIALLALLRMLDIIFALVTFLLVGLLEGFLQSQQ